MTFLSKTLSYLSKQCVGESNLHYYAEDCNQNLGFPSAEIFQIKYIYKKEKHNKIKNITTLKVTWENAEVSSWQNRQQAGRSPNFLLNPSLQISKGGD